MDRHNYSVLWGFIFRPSSCVCASLDISMKWELRNSKEQNRADHQQFHVLVKYWEVIKGSVPAEEDDEEEDDALIFSPLTELDPSSIYYYFSCICISFPDVGQILFCSQ